ncbi:hypothetical protein [Salinispora mooreana]|uniref:hypothetical protein n=1 Tax=Salinispora mooreana TaxID=999545 RepID=UPI0003AA4419|nr:hypothetical protein [Salinispora mooreana]
MGWLTTHSSTAAAHRQWLRNCRAGRWLSPGEEDLLADLDSTTAWRQLYEDTAARVTQTSRGATAWAGMASVAAACRS